MRESRLKRTRATPTRAATAAFCLLLLSSPRALAQDEKHAWSPADIRPLAGGVSSVAYDVHRSRLVALGTLQSEAITSEWDGERWTSTTFPSHSAPSRGVIAYDARRQRTVALEDGGETWEWDGQSWSLLQPSVRITERRRACMAFDEVRGRIVVFGGITALQKALGDTWEFDGSTWTLVSAQGPRARGSCVMAFDPSRGRTVLHSGSYPIGDGDDSKAARDTWAWDGTSWEWLSDDGPIVLGGPMAFDSARDVVVTMGSGFPPNNEFALWEYSKAGWERRGGNEELPSGGTAAFDARLARVVMAGARDGLWSWDGTSWEMVHSPSAPHSIQYVQSDLEPVVDPVGQRMWVLESGRDLWRWEGSRWRLEGLNGLPLRVGASAAFDTSRGRLVMFGGELRAGSGFGPRVQETWEWDGLRWEMANPQHAPSPRYSAAMAFDPLRNRTVLFGGVGPTGPVEDTWEWDGVDWTHVADKGPVTDAIRLPMAFDENSGRVLLFSATQSGTCMPGSTWAWDGVAWSLVSAGEGPVWMRGSLFFHDDIARPMIVDVGFHCDAGPADQKVGDLWDWDGSAWNARAASPGPEGEGIAAYDPFFREVVFLSANPVPRAVSFGTDTWTWKWGTCLSDSDCTTGPCEDGVCCDRACGGSDPADCQACSIAAGALTNGTCGPVVAGRICRRAMGEHPALLCTGSSEECPEPPVPPAPEPEMDAGDDATRVGEATVALRAGGGCTMRADGGRNAHGIGAAVLLVLVAVRRRPSVKRHEVRASEGSWR